MMTSNRACTLLLSALVLLQVDTASLANPNIDAPSETPSPIGPSWDKFVAAARNYFDELPENLDNQISQLQSYAQNTTPSEFRADAWNFVTSEKFLAALSLIPAFRAAHYASKIRKVVHFLITSEKTLSKPIKAGVLIAAALRTGLSKEEIQIVIDAEKLISSPEFSALRKAGLSGTEAEFQIGKYFVQTNPNLKFSAMTWAERNGFTMGRVAWSSPEETAKTILHELYRLNTSKLIGVGADAASVEAETAAAENFADRAWRLIIGSGQ